MRDNEEARLQAWAVMQLWNTRPETRGMYFMVTNDSKKSMVQAMQDKARGLVAGVLDTFLSLPSGVYHGLYIEFKSKSGRLSKEQSEFIERATRAGYLCVVVRTQEEFNSVIQFYLK